MSGRRIMAAEEMRRATIRISHEIVEKQAGTDGLVLVGIQRRGVPLARRDRGVDRRARGVEMPVGALDITFYRDDLSLVAQQPIVKGTEIPFDLNGRHGRAGGRRAVHGPHDPRGDGCADRFRAAAGDPPRCAGGPRPPGAAHPRRPRGQERPTSREEVVRVLLEETDGEDGVEIERLQLAAGAAAGHPGADGTVA